MKTDLFYQIIEEICAELGVSLHMSKEGRIVTLSWAGQEKIIWGRKFEINSIIAGRIVDSKASTFDTLRSKHIPSVEHKHYECILRRGKYFLASSSIKEIDTDLKLFHCLVVKPDNGYEGRDVYKIYSIEELQSAIDSFIKPYRYICTSPFYSSNAEYRTVCLNGQAMYTYQKILPHVIGDGKKTMAELIDKKYEDTLFASDIPSELLGSIPFENQRVTAGWRYNLSQGSTCIPLSNRELTAKIEKLAILASQAVHINFSTVDIIETDSKGLLVLEINSGVVLNKFIDNGPANYDIAKSIYRAAICSMFDGMSPE